MVWCRLLYTPFLMDRKQNSFDFRHVQFFFMFSPFSNDYYFIDIWSIVELQTKTTSASLIYCIPNENNIRADKNRESLQKGEWENFWISSKKKSTGKLECLLKSEEAM